VERKMTTKTLIIPGLLGSGDGHWQQLWLLDNPDSALVEQRSWTRPVLEEWRERLEQVLAENPGAYLVAHSLGCVLVASLAGRPSVNTIGGALLVAPCDLNQTENIHPGLIDFGPMPEAPLGFPSLVVGSLNDPYMGLDAVRRYSALWGGDFVDIGNAGHINVASGFGRWERGYALLQQLQSGVPAGCAPAATDPGRALPG
jgi:predicted alpha/beta hydrolase family esterase